MLSGVFQSEISADLPRPRQIFAQSLRDLYECVAYQDGKRISHAQLLNTVEAGHSKSSICRYFNGKNVPSEDFVMKYYKLISERATDVLPLTSEELQDLRTRAEATDGRRRQARTDAAARKDRRIEELERLLAGCGGNNDAPGVLPVPVEEGDRQSNAFAERPAPQVAAEVIELTEIGLHEQALTLLSQLSEHHNADEAAHCVAHFRTERHDDLADTLVRIYGRDHRTNRTQDVVRMSMALREMRFPDDADALLKLII
jgi:hypothetical protein